jgi:glycosyltransferase involved in cell wall biosynthesis
MYNCQKQIVRVLDQLDDEIQFYLSEVVIINNRSTDEGEQVVQDYLNSNRKKIRVSLLRNKENYGLGGSHKVAFDYAKRNGFDYIVVLHGDDQGHINNLLPYLKSKEYEKYDCFLGARFQKGAQLDGYSAFRTFGNRVYNMLFSIVTGKMIYDLGSGLNMYSVNILKDNFYLKYKDNLMFNYCMILGSTYYKHKMKFFPIRWSEDDQVSNVKMLNQAIIVLKLLGSYFINRKKFVLEEHRDNPSFRYEAEVIYTNDER